MIMKPALIRSLVALGFATTLVGQEPASEKPPTLGRLLDFELPDVLSKSKVHMNARLRWEQADQDSGISAADRDKANAFTLRTRFGITSASTLGLQAMVEAENVAALGPADNYNAAGSNNELGRAVIADPPTTELNQVWMSYSNWASVVRAGRQRIALDNHRFIGDVAWRQNMQTFDAVSFKNESIESVSLFYSYLWEVNRVFGDVPDLPLGNRDFDSDSHLLNASYAGWKHARFTGYSYFLDFSNSPGNSTATYGGHFVGTIGLDQEKSAKIHYRGELAWQTDYQSSPLSYGTEYYNLELSGEYDRFTLGGGYEVLGSDNGQGFKTPLATLHAFNGWADVFVVTPALGLRDLYAFVEVTLPAKIPLRLLYHKYDAATGDADFGQEFNAVLSKKFGKHWTALAKYAYYDGKNAAVPSFGAASDTHKIWAQVEFNF